MDKFLDNVPYVDPSENSVDTQLYHEVLKWTCILDGLKCKGHVATLLDWHFQDPVQHKYVILSSIQQSLYNATNREVTFFEL